MIVKVVVDQIGMATKEQKTKLERVKLKAARSWPYSIECVDGCAKAFLPQSGGGYTEPQKRDRK
jgi:hypothetical protein